MKRSHLQVLRPICPTCKVGAITLREVVRGDAASVTEGLLECANPSCRHLFPIIDGIPILVAGLRRMVSEQVLNILGRDDLSETLTGLIGECCGPSSPLDSQRQHLSSYGWSHWGDLDQQNGPLDGAGQVAGILALGLQKLRHATVAWEGPVIDLGCSIGRTSFDLACRMPGRDSVVLGIDLNFAMLRVAQEALRTGQVRYPRRQSGLIYEERSLPIAAGATDPLDFWCADALALPFPPATFGLATSLNLLDCVPSPLAHLASLRDLVRPGGAALVATPFDWSPSATAPEAWVGGHSPYDEAGGRSERVLRSLLGGNHPAAINGLHLVDEVDGLDWTVRLHNRSAMHYAVDLFVLQRESEPVPATP